MTNIHAHPDKLYHIIKWLNIARRSAINNGYYNLAPEGTLSQESTYYNKT